MTDDEFIALIRDERICNVFFDPQGYFHQYIVMVCNNKKKWIDCIHGAKHLPLVVVVYANKQYSDQRDQMFSYEGTIVSGDISQISGDPQFVPLWEK
jgi:hypothetical protein